MIDPRRDGPLLTANKMRILKNTLLSQRNIRGNTPLDAITRHFGRNMASFVDVERIGNGAIGFNLITDGEPNDKKTFERELRYCFDRLID